MTIIFYLLNFANKKNILALVYCSETSFDHTNLCFLQIKLTRLVGRKATGKGKAILKAAGWFCLNEKAKIDSRWTRSKAQPNKIDLELVDGGKASKQPFLFANCHQLSLGKLALASGRLPNSISNSS